MSHRVLAFLVGIVAAGLVLSTNWQPNVAHADDEQAVYPHILLISIPGLSFMELQPEIMGEWPYLKKELSRASVAAMNIRTADRNLQTVYASMSAGRAAAAASDMQSFAADEPAGGGRARELMLRYSGYRAQANEQVLVPRLASFRPTTPPPFASHAIGELGEQLKRAGILRKVLGNCDLGWSVEPDDERRLRRYGTLLLTDSHGTVDGGSIGKETLLAAPDRPYGVKSDYGGFLQEIDADFFAGNEKGASPKPPLIELVELGDLYRLHADKKNFTEERFRQIRSEVLREMDEFLGRVASRRAANMSLWIFSPEVNRDAFKAKSMFAPLIRLNESDRSAGLLYSSSTRRAGIVTYQDFTASLLQEMGLPSPGMDGQPVRAEEIRRSAAPRERAILDPLLRQLTEIQLVYRLRPLLLYPFATYEIVVLLIGLLCILYFTRKHCWVNAAVFVQGRSGTSTFIKWWLNKKGAEPRILRIVRLLLLSILIAPLAMLLMGLAVTPLTSWASQEKTMIGAAAALFIMLVLLTSFVVEKLQTTASLMWLSILTSALITADCLTDSHAMKSSILGYDPMIGARYYGIGNEYMGVILGALVLGVTAALQRRHDLAVKSEQGRETGRANDAAGLDAAEMSTLVTGRSEADGGTAEVGMVVGKCDEGNGQEEWEGEDEGGEGQGQEEQDARVQDAAGLEAVEISTFVTGRSEADGGTAEVRMVVEKCDEGNEQVEGQGQEEQKKQRQNKVKEEEIGWQEEVSVFGGGAWGLATERRQGLAEGCCSAVRPTRAAAWLSCGAFLLVTACLASPSLGANAGGALSAAAAFGAAGALCFAGGRWRELRPVRTAVLLAALLALGLAALWLLNSADSPAASARESHVGRAFHALRAGRFDQIGDLIVRKLRMNAHLIGASAWSKVLITSLFVMTALVLRPRGRLSLWQRKYPYWMYGFSANTLGAIAALLLNDSGIVAAATMIVYVAVPMLLLRLDELAAKPRRRLTPTG